MCVCVCVCVCQGAGERGGLREKGSEPWAW